MTYTDPAEMMAKILHDDECRSGKACQGWGDTSHRYTWERKVRRLSPALDAVRAEARAEVERERDRAFGNQRWMEGHILGIKDGRAEVAARVEAELDNTDHEEPCSWPYDACTCWDSRIRTALVPTADTNLGGDA